jgi:protein TonB
MGTLFLSVIAMAVVGTGSAMLLILFLMKSGAKNTDLAAFDNAKKYPFADLERYRFLSMNVGLVISLGIVLTAFEWKSPIDLKLPSLDAEFTSEEMVNVPITKQETPPPPSQKILTNPEVKIVEDDKVIEKMEVKFETENPEEAVSANPVKIETPEPEAEVVEDDFVLVAEVNAEPEGGMEGLLKYLAKNIKYPRQAQKLGVEGKVLVQFMVNKDGSLSDFSVLKGVGAGCDEEAMRVLRESKAWKPAKQRGRAVKQRIVLPVVFKLSR